MARCKKVRQQHDDLHCRRKQKKRQCKAFVQLVRIGGDRAAYLHHPLAMPLPEDFTVRRVLDDPPLCAVRFGLLRELVVCRRRIDIARRTIDAGERWRPLFSAGRSERSKSLPQGWWKVPTDSPWRCIEVMLRSEGNAVQRRAR
ncbi:DNA mismatch repair protein mutS [Anopheles sinensis]|uniref:DNA mismatch repair protein mutS n=1 Tax=Anopheles sinensis TaxID=74873 RepID=A0A084WH04_ANOSI|nr:DNA mismatch repair protein mutS [Anopheles sinensis]